MYGPSSGRAHAILLSWSSVGGDTPLLASAVHQPWPVASSNATCTASEKLASSRTFTVHPRTGSGRHTPSSPHFHKRRCRKGWPLKADQLTRISSDNPRGNVANRLPFSTGPSLAGNKGGTSGRKGRAAGPFAFLLGRFALMCLSVLGANGLPSQQQRARRHQHRPALLLPAPRTAPTMRGTRPSIHWH